MKRRHIFGYTEIGEAGKSVGQTHHMAKLTDAEVENIRRLHDEGYGYRKLAKMFDTPRETIRDIVRCKFRAQIVVSIKKHGRGGENE